MSIILQCGTYTKKQILEMNLGTNGQLPKSKEDLIICNPYPMMFNSYRVSKVKEDGHYVYKITLM